MVNGEQDPYTGRIRILAAADALSGTFTDYNDLTQDSPMSHGFPAVVADGSNVHMAWQLDWDDGLGNVDGDIMYAVSWDGLATVYGPYEIQATPARAWVRSSPLTGGAVAAGGWRRPPAATSSSWPPGPPPSTATPTAGAAWSTSPTSPWWCPSSGRPPARGGDGLLAAWIDRRDYATAGYNLYGSDRGLVPDLQPFTPDQGWEPPGDQPHGRRSARRRQPGPGVPIYTSLAVANLGLADAAGPVEFELRLDGDLLAAWQVDDGLPRASAVTVEDHVLDLAPGAHQLTLVVDPRDLVAEANEADNTVTSDLWVPTGEPTLELDPPGLVIQADAPIAAPLRRLPTGGAPVVDPRLADALQRAATGDRLRVVVTPAERLDPVALASLPHPVARRALRDHAARIAASFQARAAAPLRSLWLSGELVGELTAAEIDGPGDHSRVWSPLAR